MLQTIFDGFLFGLGFSIAAAVVFSTADFVRQYCINRRARNKWPF